MTSERFDEIKAFYASDRGIVVYTTAELLARELIREMDRLRATLRELLT